MDAVHVHQGEGIVVSGGSGDLSAVSFGGGFAGGVTISGSQSESVDVSVTHELLVLLVAGAMWFSVGCMVSTGRESWAGRHQVSAIPHLLDTGGEVLFVEAPGRHVLWGE